MGLCASMLRRRIKKQHRHPEPRRGTPRALFVVRGDRRSATNPDQALVFRVQDSGRTRLQKPASEAETGRLPERCWRHGTDAALGRMLCAQMPRLPCVGATTVGVEPDGPVPVSKTAALRVAPPSPPAAPVTPASSAAMTPMRPARCAAQTASPMTPGRPVWQRRILMGTRCELPRFSGLILYDEQGRRLQIGTPGRRNHRQGKKKTARTSATTTLRDIL